jgi:endonuclease YncB( thermonuclease family)
MRFFLRLFATLFILSMLSVFLLVTCARAEVITGRADRVADGDTLTVQGVRVRLNGVDAPEMDTAMGPRARAEMIDIVDGRMLACDLGGVSYDRRVGVCFLTDGPDAGADIGQLLIRQGLALDCRRYSGGRYAGDETPTARAMIAPAPYC